MKKLYQSKILNNLDKFMFANTETGLMRQNLDMFLYWKINEYIKADNILEIGTFAGQTLGLMIEASGKTDGIYTSVDLSFDNLSNLESMFSNMTIDCIKTDSVNLNLIEQYGYPVLYDIVHIDGNHSYEYVINDIKKIIPHLHKNSILIFDDYYLSGVNNAIDDFLSNNDIGFVPFMQGDQSIFFHHCNNDLEYFLDEYIYKNDVNDFMYLENTRYKKYVVLKGQLLNVFNKHHDLFLQTLKIYNI